MRKSTQRLAALLALTLAGTVAAELVIVEEAIETQPIDLQLTSESSGLVYAGACEGCETVQLVVTRTTRASFGGKPIALRDVPQYAHLGGTILYDRATRIVTRIMVWQ
jgi:hypothetical protein